MRQAVLRRAVAELASASAQRGLLLPELEGGQLYRFASDLALERRLVLLDGEDVVLGPEGRALLAYYANSIAHHRRGSRA